MDRVPCLLLVCKNLKSAYRIFPSHGNIANDIYLGSFWQSSAPHFKRLSNALFSWSVPTRWHANSLFVGKDSWPVMRQAFGGDTWSKSSHQCPSTQIRCPHLISSSPAIVLLVCTASTPPSTHRPSREARLWHPAIRDPMGEPVFLTLDFICSQFPLD